MKVLGPTHFAIAILCITWLGCASQTVSDADSMASGAFNADDGAQSVAPNPDSVAVNRQATPGQRGQNSDINLNSTDMTADLVQGCDGQWLRSGIPSDLTLPGPWPVGVTSVEIEGLTTEIWYPAEPGSETMAAPLTYDFRAFLPLEERERIPDANAPKQRCNCYQDIPIDRASGPFPVIIFMHGTALFRTSHLENVTHWASRGFVVLAADHPEVQLCDMLATLTRGTHCGAGGRDRRGDVQRLLRGLQNNANDVAFLKSAIDIGRIGIMGHSGAAVAAAGFGDMADVLILHGNTTGTVSGSRVRSSLFFGGDQDGVSPHVAHDLQETGRTQTRRAVITRGGHLVGGSVCALRDPLDPVVNILDLANEFALGGALLGDVLPATFELVFDGCNEQVTDDIPYIRWQLGVDLLNALSAGVLHEALHCSPSAAAQIQQAQYNYEMYLQGNLRQP